MTRGTFALCHNPIYASYICFLIPAIALLVDSWGMLGASLVMYVAFKLRIGREYQELRQAFGAAYAAYEVRVNELWPLPHLRKGVEACALAR